MMLYLCAKKEGNVQLFGVKVDELPASVVAKQTELTEGGYELADSSEYTSQLLKGAQAGQPGQEDKVPEVNVEEGKMPEQPATT